MLGFSVAEAVAEELVAAGVDRVFGLPGGEVLSLMEALRQRGVEFVLCRHEANAGIAAAVYGKLKRVPGVVLTTLGPGAANLMLAISNSLLDREPLLAISATLPESLPASHTHQKLPLLDVYRPITKFCAALDGLVVRETMRQALSTSIREPAGPVFLTVSAESAVSPAYATPTRPPATSPGNPPTLGDPDAMARELRQRLEGTQRPLVLLGLGVRPECAVPLRRWIEAWQLPVAVTPKAKGLVDETSDLFVGTVGGMAIDNLMTQAVRSADLLVGFGFDPVEVDKSWHAELPIIWVLESPLATGVVPPKNLLAVDHLALLHRLVEAEPPSRWEDPFSLVRRRRLEMYHVNAARDDAPSTSVECIAPIDIVRSLATALPPETVVTTDVGAHKYVFGQFWPSRHPLTFFMSNGLSGMGYGLAAALGAKLAKPKVPVLAAVGDGGFSMNSQELETASRVGAPLLVVVLADRSYSLIRLAQESRGLPAYGVDFSPIDSVLTARACGVPALRAESPAHLGAVVGEAAAKGEGLLVEVPVDPSSFRKFL